VLEELIDLAEAQIAAMFGRATNLDTQALGLVAFDAALVAADLAAQQPLGNRWWVPIPGLAISILAGASVMAVTRFDLGPSPSDFYTQNAESPRDEALAQLLSDLVASQRRNSQPLRLKTGRLVVALATLLLTIVYSVPVIAL
jgi:hypothetical protein